MADTTSPIRVLHVEDSRRDAEMIRDMLEADSPAYDVVRVDNRAQFESTLAEGTIDIVICDFSLPDLDGLTALKLAKSRFPDIPVLVVSGAIDPGEAVECLKEGATDYLLKQRLERLPSAVRRALEDSKQRRLHQEMETQLRESEERFRQLANKSREGFWFVGLNPERILYVSPAVETIWGLSADSFYQDPRVWLGAVHADDRARMQDAWEAWAKDQSRRFEEECRIVRPDGSVRWVLNSGTQIRDEAGAITRLSGLTHDVTERKELEAQFHQAQKMESVGRLAGGIAHDFNNLLTVINGISELVLAQVGKDDQVHADIQEIHRAGERAAVLTRQLLAFSRRQILVPRVMNVNTVVAGMESLLQRLLGADINLVVVSTQGVSNVNADPGQIEQVITNLAVNARDAMPQGGQLIIETQNVTIDEGYGRQHGVAMPTGSYVLLDVSDSGVGMDAATRARIFEPFFTTKGPGKGTGLGLSTVYGIVKQSHGFIWVDSEVGQGTSFKIYLPQVTAAAGADQPRPTVPSSSGTETILLVEDDAGLCRLATRFLEPAGYTVLGAATGEEALRVLERHGEPVHLLLTDVVMPGMSGRGLADRIAQTRPGVKILYMSGYTDDIVVRHGVSEEQVPFLSKPFTAWELLQKVREVLDFGTRRPTLAAAYADDEG
ncbi:MAG: response regulator [Acidobacteria bacterium]|nr:response regulator [Acidobacteriota bacterium]